MRVSRLGAIVVLGALVFNVSAGVGDGRVLSDGTEKTPQVAPTPTPTPTRISEPHGLLSTTAPPHGPPTIVVMDEVPTTSPAFESPASVGPPDEPPSTSSPSTTLPTWTEPPQETPTQVPSPTNTIVPSVTQTTDQPPETTVPSSGAPQLTPPQATSSPLPTSLPMPTPAMTPTSTPPTTNTPATTSTPTTTTPTSTPTPTPWPIPSPSTSPPRPPPPSQTSTETPVPMPTPSPTPSPSSPPSSTPSSSPIPTSAQTPTPTEIPSPTATARPAPDFVRPQTPSVTAATPTPTGSPHTTGPLVVPGMGNLGPNFTLSPSANRPNSIAIVRPPTPTPPTQTPSPVTTTTPPAVPTSPPLVTPSVTPSSLVVSPQTPGPGQAGPTPVPPPTTAAPNPTPSVGGFGGDGASADVKTPTPPISPPLVISSSPPRTQSPNVKATDAPVAYVRDRVNVSRGNDSQSSSNKDTRPLIIGGLNDHNSTDPTGQGVTALSRAKTVAPTYRVLQYVVSICAALSVMLLIGFHGLAVDARFEWSEVVCSPTTWEFVVYVSYIQHLASLSQLVLVKTPPSLWTVLDELSWTCFLPYHWSDAAVGTVVTTAIGTSRRLETILLSGMVAFANRVGFRENDLLGRSVTGLALLAGVCLVFFFVFAAVAKRRMDVHDAHPSLRYNTGEVRRVTFWRSTAMRVCTLLVLLWLFALYPLSAAATYEVTMELRANMLSPAQLILAVISMLVVCLGGLLLVGYSVASRSQCELREPFQIAAWGSLYADYIHRKRSFLVAPVLLQIATGVVVGAGGAADVQLVLLLAILAVYLLALWVVQPFVAGSVAPWFIVAVTLLKIANLSIAVAGFTLQNAWTSDARASAADAIVYLNTLVVVCWLLRHGGVLVQSIRHVRAAAVANANALPQPTPSESLPPLQASPEGEDCHTGGFLAVDSQKSLNDSEKHASYRGMTPSLRSWKKHHLSVA